MMVFLQSDKTWWHDPDSDYIWFDIQNWLLSLVVVHKCDFGSYSSALISYRRLRSALNGSSYLEQYLQRSLSIFPSWHRIPRDADAVFVCMRRFCCTTLQQHGLSSCSLFQLPKALGLGLLWIVRWANP